MKVKGDKRMITATFTSTLSGEFLPFQILYTGKAERSHPHYAGFSSEFDVWHSSNHCANQETSLRLGPRPAVTHVRRMAESALEEALQTLRQHFCLLGKAS